MQDSANEKKKAKLKAILIIDVVIRWEFREKKNTNSSNNVNLFIESNLYIFDHMKVPQTWWLFTLLRKDLYLNGVRTNQYIVYNNNEYINHITS